MPRLKMLAHAAIAIVALSAPAAGADTECNRIELTSSAKFDDDEKPSFSAVAVLDLHPWLVLSTGRRGDTESPELELRYFGPNGHLYQSVSFPVEGEGDAKRVEGYPRHVKIAKKRAIVHKGQKKRIVEAPAFPVAGTAIVTSSLYGRWRLEAWEPGARRATCSIDFKLRP